MTIDQRLEEIAKQQQIDGKHIHQLALIIHEQSEGIKGLTNGITGLLEIVDRKR
jgi:hypothetical protein